MEHREAVALVAAGVPERGGRWVDLGAGSGVFARALSELLGASGEVVALDRRPPPAPPEPPFNGAPIRYARGDFTRPLPLRDLDGALMANALHFVRRPERALPGIVAALKPGGRLLLVEYDLQRGTPWVPFPVPPRRFAELAAAAGLEPPREIGRRPSRYGARELYAAVARKAS